MTSVNQLALVDMDHDRSLVVQHMSLSPASTVLSMCILLSTKLLFTCIHAMHATPRGARLRLHYTISTTTTSLLITCMRLA
jgi:hypothetical protein